MPTINEVEGALNSVLKNSDLHDLASIIADSAWDKVLGDNLNNIPIVGPIIALYKASISLKDQLFLKKVFRFLTELKDIPANQRKAMIEQIDNSVNYRINVGEKLIFILERCDDYKQTEYIGQFFTAYLNENINYDEFLRGARVINNSFISDLEKFLQEDIKVFEFESSPYSAPNDDHFLLINSGICGFGFNPITVKDQWDWKATEKYRVEGGEAVMWVTEIGRKLKAHLQIRQLRSAPLFMS
ncbi:MAG: hypothetical protein LAT52_10985 [Balneolales bacterium]|nr:hypothetical protein [Balneolales bacterium]